MEPTFNVESPVITSLRRLYYRPGPYVSINISVHAGSGAAAESLPQRWEAIDLELQRRKTSPLVIEELAARVLARPPAWAASLSVLAASDGTVVSGHGPEPFFADMVVVDTLPYVTPLLTWSQLRGPHLTLTDQDDAGIDLFADDAPIGHDIAMEPDVADDRSGPTHLVLLGQPAATRPLAEMITTSTERRFQVVAETRLIDTSELNDQRTRTGRGRPADSEPYVVHRSVSHLPDITASVDDVQRVLDRLRAGDVDVVVLSPDDTLDQRRVWVGLHATDLSLTGEHRYEHQARLVDAVARAALVSGASVVVRTDADGPDRRFAA